MKDHEFLVGGNWRRSNERVDIIFPHTGEVAGRIYQAGREDLEEALVCAVRGFEITRELSGYRKADILTRLADEVKERSDELAETMVLEGGKTCSFASSEVLRAISTLRVSAEEAKRIGGEVIPLDWSAESEGRIAVTRRFPLGPVLGIIPFNFPLNLACHKLGPAIAAGNSIILKPASSTPLTTLMLGEMALAAGFPGEALSVVPCPGPRIEPLVSDDRIALLSFTGSPEVGWRLKQLAGRKRVCLELGGNAATVVHDDAHLPYTAGRIVTGGFANAGQVCISVQRVFLHRDIYDRALDMILEGVKRLSVGDPRYGETDVGPMIDPGAAERAFRKVQEALDSGAVALAGGEKPEGALFKPTVLANTTPGMRVCREEIFAPVITVTPYEEFREAIKMANESRFGLQIGIFTQNIGRAMYAFEHAEAGGIQVNDIPTFRMDHMPYGGVKWSGIGKEGPKYAIEEMTELKLLSVNRAGGLE